MDEFELRSRLLQIENETFDFKQELILNSASSKAEFVKDVISIANSSPDKGYLIVGVDKAHQVIGIEQLEEEQLQQIASTYISPPVQITCSYIFMNESGRTLKVGLVEIRALKKPHQVARSIDRLKQYDVFVRRGSVVTNASPAEIIAMNSSGVKTIIPEIEQRAKVLVKIGNLDAGISLYTEAIDILPCADLLISRAKIYEDKKENLLAWNDYSNSLKLHPTLFEEKEARLGRVRQYLRVTSDKYSWEVFENDYNWLREHTEGRERGEVIYTYIKSLDYLATDGLEEGELMVSTVDEAISLGYEEPEIYFLRSIGNKAASNFGVALHDIDKAISMIKIDDRKVEFLCHRAEILISMKCFNEANNILREAYKINKEIVRKELQISLYKTDEEIMCTLALQKKYLGKVNCDSFKFMLLKMLLLWESRELTFWTTDSGGRIKNYETRLNQFGSRYPGIISSLLRLMTDEDKKVMNDINSPYQYLIKLPSIKDQLTDKNNCFISLPLDDDNELLD